MKRGSAFLAVGLTVIALLFWLNVALNHGQYRPHYNDVFSAVGASLAAAGIWLAEYRARNTGG